VCRDPQGKPTFRGSKHKAHPYLHLPERETTWLKIRNHSYSQWAGRVELFERERDVDPDEVGWGGCVAACATIFNFSGGTSM
jgi:hypothetical protein